MVYQVQHFYCGGNHLKRVQIEAMTIRELCQEAVKRGIKPSVLLEQCEPLRAPLTPEG